MRKFVRFAAVLALLVALPVHAGAVDSVLQAVTGGLLSTEPAAPEATAVPIKPSSESLADDSAGQGVLRGESTVYIGEVATAVEDSWECSLSFSLGSTTIKCYDTMVGNILRLTVYSTIPQDAESQFYIPMDSHIAYVDGTDKFTEMGRSGDYYCYQKAIRITGEGMFDLAVANTNGTLYNGIYDTIGIRAMDKIETLDFFAEQSAADPAVTHFFVTANGSYTALITPDTVGFYAADNEWKIVTAEKTEKVLFSDTVYNGYSFDPQTISLSIAADEAAQANPTSISVYYLGLINGKLFTVGPYTFPASATTYSSSFELARNNMDVLASEDHFTFYAYIESGRTPDITVTDEKGVAELTLIEPVESDWEGMDKLAVHVAVRNTAEDMDLLVGNRWSSNQIAYNYRTLHVGFLREIQSLVLTADPQGHYDVLYSAAVNGQQDLDTSMLNWYINGELQSEHGLTLSRTFTRGGKYSVYAQLGEMTSNTVESNIIYSSAQAMFWYLLTALVVVIGVAAAIRSSHRKSGRADMQLRSQLQALLTEVENEQLKLVRGQSSPRAALRALHRSDQRLFRICDELRLRFADTNVAVYNIAAKTLHQTYVRSLSAGRAAGNDVYCVKAVFNSYRQAIQDALDNLSEVVATLAVK